MSTRRLSFHWFLLLTVSFAAGCASPIEPGVWSIEGLDPVHGSYQGALEIRRCSGELGVIRVIEFGSTITGDGRRVSTVWTGRCRSIREYAAIAEFSLDRAHFISAARGLTRSDADRTPLEVRCRITEGPGRDLFVDYVAPENPDFTIGETGVFANPVGSEPIWRSGRTVEPSSEGGLSFHVFKPMLFGLLRNYHRQPAIRPFTRTTAFREARHFVVVDRTDFDFYRSNPDQIRLVDRVVDPISLAEEEIRASTFQSSFEDKASYYQNIMDAGLVGRHGMVLNRMSPGGAEQPDQDGALWTGIYAYTQALRYRLSGDAGALSNLRKSLHGLFTLMDITGDPRTFARTLRLAGPPLAGSWVRGKGDFAHLDWLAGGNNDMSRGLVMGIIAGWSALPPGDALRETIPRRTADLLELCIFMEDSGVDCDPEGTSLHLPSVNPGIAKLLAGLTNHRQEWIEEGHAWLRQPLLMAYANRGGGPFYLNGISDWSGNHLTLLKTLGLQWALARTGERRLETAWVRASAEAWRVLRQLEPPLHAALAVASGSLIDPTERSEARIQAIWGLQSFPAPKHPYPIDHRIRDDFVMSPFPSLPWKFDWTTNSERHQSLVARGIIEGPMTSYVWVGNPFSFVSDGTGDAALPGVDYLFLYWIARNGGLITKFD